MSLADAVKKATQTAKNTYNSNKKKNSGGSSSGGGATVNSNGTITSQNSYNGEYITFDTNTDYQKKINDAVAAGNVSDAAKYEAQRNEKIKYLNGLNQNTNGYTTTDNYTKVYSDPSGKGYKNNQGGDVYTNSYNSPSDLGTSILGTGQTINQVNNGNAVYRNKTLGNGKTVIQQKVSNTGNDLMDWEDVGTGVNKTTGEFLKDADMAKKAYVQSLIGYTDYNDTGDKYTAQYDALANNGRVDNEYLNALQSGTTVDYDRRILANVPVNDNPVQNTNSFETDVANTTRNTTGNATEESIKNVDSPRYRTADEYARKTGAEFGNNEMQTSTDYTGNWRYQEAPMPNWMDVLMNQFNIPVDIVQRSYR